MILAPLNVEAVHWSQRQTLERKERTDMKKMSVRFLAALGVALAGGVLTSCHTEHTINIGLSQGNVGVYARQTVVLRASPEFDDLEAPLTFQWQTNSVEGLDEQAGKPAQGEAPNSDELNWVDIPGQQ